MIPSEAYMEELARIELSRVEHIKYPWPARGVPCCLIRKNSASWAAWWMSRSIWERT